MKRERTDDPNIFRLKTGIYYYRKGNVERSLKTNSFRDAVRNKNNMLAKADPILRSNLRLTFGVVVDDYLECRKEDVRQGKIRQSTYDETYMILGKHLEPYFRITPIAKIRTSEWNEYVSKKSKAIDDLTNHRKILSHFMRWAVMHDLIHAMPIYPLSHTDRRKRRILKQYEISKIWENARGNLRLFISLALLMGMRRSEIIKLRWKSINFENQSLNVEAWTAKTGQSRILPIANSAFELLKERYAQAKLSKHEWVFPNASDPKRHADKSGLKTAWETCKRRAGLSNEDITFHDLRATCEYYAHKRRDVTATQLEKFFGSSVDVQRKIYVSMDADDLRGLEESLFVKK